MSVVPNRPRINESNVSTVVDRVLNGGTIINMASDVVEDLIFNYLLTKSTAAPITVQLFEVYNNKLFPLTSQTDYIDNVTSTKHVQAHKLYNIDDWHAIQTNIQHKRNNNRGHYITRVCNSTPFHIINVSPPPPSTTLPTGHNPMHSTENLHLSRSNACIRMCMESRELQRVKWRDCLITKFIYENTAKVPVVIGNVGKGWRWYGRVDGIIPRTLLSSTPTTNTTSTKATTSNGSTPHNATVSHGSKKSQTTNTKSYLPTKTAHIIRKSVPSSPPPKSSTSKPSTKTNGILPISSHISTHLTPKRAVICRDIIKKARALESTSDLTSAVSLYESTRVYLPNYPGLERKISLVKGRINAMSSSCVSGNDVIGDVVKGDDVDGLGGFKCDVGGIVRGRDSMDVRDILGTVEKGKRKDVVGKEEDKDEDLVEENVKASKIVSTPLKGATPMRVVKTSDDDDDDDDEDVVEENVKASKIVSTPLKGATPMRVVKTSDEDDDDEEVEENVKASKIVSTPLKGATPMRVVVDKGEDEDEDVVEENVKASKIVSTPLKGATPMRVVKTSDEDDDDEEVVEENVKASKIVSTPLKGATPMRVVKTSDDDDEEEDKDKVETIVAVTKIASTPLKGATPMRVVKATDDDDDDGEMDDLESNNPPLPPHTATNISSTPILGQSMRVVPSNNVGIKLVSTPLAGKPERVKATMEVEDHDEGEKKPRRLKETPLKGKPERVTTEAFEEFSEEDFLPPPASSVAPPTPPQEAPATKASTPKLTRTPLKGLPTRVVAEESMVAAESIVPPTPPQEAPATKASTPKLARTPLKGLPTRVVAEESMVAAEEEKEEEETTEDAATEGVTASTSLSTDPLLVLLNTGSSSDLLTLPGVGAKRAERIVSERSNGTFSDVEDLKRVGLTGKQIEKVKGMFGEKENEVEEKGKGEVGGKGERRRSTRRRSIVN